MINVLTAVAVMVAATLAQHLGLTQAISRIISKIAGCNMCCTFWACLLVLILSDVKPHEAALLSIFSAYASHWFVFVLMFFQLIYDKIWQRMKRK